MNRLTVPLMMAFLFFWVPLLHSFACADAFLLPKDLAALSLSVVLMVLWVSRSGLAPWKGPFPLLVLIAAWMLVDGWRVGYSSPVLLQASIHLVLWVGAFAVFVVKFWPILTRARADGRPG